MLDVTRKAKEAFEKKAGVKALGFHLNKGSMRGYYSAKVDATDPVVAKFVDEFYKNKGFNELRYLGGVGVRFMTKMLTQPRVSIDIPLNQLEI